MKPWTMSLLLAGLVLATVGPWLAGVIVPPTALWSNADAQALNEARAQLHAAAAAGPSQHGGLASAPLDEAYRAQDARSQAARSRRAWLLWGVRILGVLLALVGLAGYFARQS